MPRATTHVITDVCSAFAGPCVPALRALRSWQCWEWQEAKATRSKEFQEQKEGHQPKGIAGLRLASRLARELKGLRQGE